MRLGFIHSYVPTLERDIETVKTDSVIQERGSPESPMSITKRLSSLLLCAATLCGTATSVRAASDEPDRWQLITTPFLCGTNIEGDITIHARTLEVTGLQVRW